MLGGDRLLGTLQDLFVGVCQQVVTESCGDEGALEGDERLGLGALHGE